MAQIVGYWENNVVFTEGPFVIVNINGWRIEVEMKGHKCPVLPDCSIDKLLWVELAVPCSKYPKEEAIVICNWLNKKVKEGIIILSEKVWIAKEYKGHLPPFYTWREAYYRRLTVF